MQRLRNVMKSNTIYIFVVNHTIEPHRIYNIAMIACLKKLPSKILICT